MQLMFLRLPSFHPVKNILSKYSNYKCQNQSKTHCCFETQHLYNVIDVPPIVTQIAQADQTGDANSSDCRLAKGIYFAEINQIWNRHADVHNGYCCYYYVIMERSQQKNSREEDQLTEVKNFYIFPHVLLCDQFAHNCVEGHWYKLADYLYVGNEGFIKSSIDSLGLEGHCEKFEALGNEEEIYW